MLDPDFYRAFEDKMRGPRPLISQRLESYLPFLNALRAAGKTPRALDLGCGRGEWLELLKRLDIRGVGVDLDEGMLTLCRERQLNALKADVNEYLSGLEDCSLDLISGFHIVEHLSLEHLQILIREAHRVLKPEGLLILETPNPENLWVGAHTFYLDPTHQRPIPPLLLSFLVEYARFQRQTILRLNEAEHIKDHRSISLWDVLDGASPDYSIVAQKISDTLIARGFDPAFEIMTGVTTQTMAQRHEEEAKARFSDIHMRVQDLASQNSSAEVTIKALANHLDETRQNLLATIQSNTEETARGIQATLNQVAETHKTDTLELIKTHLASFEERFANHEEKVQTFLEQGLEASRGFTRDFVQDQIKLPQEAQRQQLETEIGEIRQVLRDHEVLIAEQNRRESLYQALIAEQNRRESLNQALIAEQNRRESLNQASSAAIQDQQKQAEAEARALREQVAALHNRAEFAEAQLESMTVQALAWHEQILRLQKSISWKLTAPLRGIRKLSLYLIRKLFGGLRLLGWLLLLLVILPLTPLLLISIPWVLKRPALRDRLGKRIYKHPRLRSLLRSFAFKSRMLDPSETQEPAPPLREQLQPAAPPSSIEKTPQPALRALHGLEGRISRILDPLEKPR